MLLRAEWGTSIFTVFCEVHFVPFLGDSGKYFKQEMGVKCYYHYFGTMMDNNNILRHSEILFYGSTKRRRSKLCLFPSGISRNISQVSYVFIFVHQL